MPSASSAPTLPFLERLLDGEKVEWKTLGEVCNRTKGTKITATQMKAMHKSNAPVKIFAGGQTFALVDYNDLPQSDIYFFPSIIVKSRGIIEFEYYDKPFSHKSEMWSYHTNSPDVNAKFLYYYLKTHEDYFQQLGSVMQMPQISIPTTEKFPIPLPPLRVQSRIVEILEKFTQLEAQLEAELQTELEARNKQYDFYRNRLLDFALRDDLKGQVEWKTLGEVCNVVGRIGFRGYTRNDLVERGEGAISISPTNIVNQNLNLSAEKNTYISWEKYNESPEIKIRVGDIVLVKTGSTIGKVAIVRELNEKATINPQMVVLKGISCLPAYLAYYVCTPNFQLRLKSLSGQGSVPNISQAKLKTIPIPLPPLSEQRRIVDILDRFDTLTNSISEGLPREIALRRKQYEYYRDALLRFPPPAPTA